MKRLLATILVLIVLFAMASCGVFTTPALEVVTVTQTVEGKAITVVQVIDPHTGNRYTINPGEVGVGNADMRINGYFTGYTASGEFLVLNGKDIDYECELSVTPYYNDEITATPANVADWVTVTSARLGADGVLRVPPMEAAAVTVSLYVPKGTELPSKWGFVVHAIPFGMVRAGNDSRWLVYMQQ